MSRRKEVGMESLLAVLGFTTTVGIIWNSIAYGAVILIIIGILREQWRMWLFAVGASTLALFAYFFLGDGLLTTLQVVAVLPPILQILKETPRRQRELLLGVTAIALFALFASGSVHTLLQFLVIGGLLAISYGIISLPLTRAFPTMALGGVLIGIYAFETDAYAFFMLNIAYVVANMWEWHRNFRAKAQSV